MGLVLRHDVVIAVVSVVPRRLVLNFFGVC